MKKQLLVITVIALSSMCAGEEQSRVESLTRTDTGLLAARHRVIVRSAVCGSAPAWAEVLTSDACLYTVAGPDALSHRDQVGSKFPAGSVVEPDLVVESTGNLEIPLPQQYEHLANLFQIRAPEAWTVTSGDDKTVVLVIDTGIDTAHPDLVHSIWKPKDGYSVYYGLSEFVCNEGSSGFDVLHRTCAIVDDNGHGTHVSGIIAARGAIVGVAPMIRVAGIKMLDLTGRCLLSDALRAMDVAAQLSRKFSEIRVVSASWLIHGFSQALCDSVASLAKQGVLVVASAGNERSRLDESNPTMPGSCPGVAVVGAVDKNNGLASFSNVGEVVKITAPGVQVLSTYPGGGYAVGTGTSMSAPHVSGVAALLFSMDKSLTPWKAAERIFSTASPINQYLQDLVPGGCVNAAGAVVFFK